jgi:toxin-antitoxin system PIN domain toxin
VIAVDTNILVYAHREESPWHEKASELLSNLAEGRGEWAIPWPCLHEFLAIVTHPRIFKTPTPVAVALDAVQGLLEAPGVVLLAEGEGYWPMLKTHVQRGRIVGPAVHDARIAALCAAHGVRELWSADRDFGRFPALSVRNPLVG